MKLMSNGFAIRNTSAPILPMPSEPRVRPTSPTPMWSCRLLQPGGPLRVSRSFIVSSPVSASMKVITATATGRRTPSGVIASAQPCSVQAFDVDGVVADAKARHDREPAVARKTARLDPGHQQDQGIEALEVRGVERPLGGDELIVERRVLLERREIEVGIGGTAVRLLEIAAERDAKLAHRSLPAIISSWLCGRPSPGSSTAAFPVRARISVRPAWTAPCSAHTSPE